MLCFRKKFSQSILDDATGGENPGGFCFGLAAYWIVACRNNDEKKFWADIEKSITPIGPSEETPLIYGEGYASLAGRFQKKLGNDWRKEAEELFANKARLKRTEIRYEKNKSFFDDKIAVSDIMWPMSPKKPAKYSILVICAAEYSHALGLVQNDDSIELFDPNCGVLVGQGSNFDARFNSFAEILRELDRAYQYNYRSGYEIFSMYEK